MSFVVVNLSELIEQVERMLLAEKKVKELEDVIKNSKKTVKERTPEEQAELHAKRVEAGKKGAAKRKEKKEEALLAQAKAEIEAQIYLRDLIEFDT